MNHFIQPPVIGIGSDYKYEGFVFPTKDEIEAFWYEFHKTLFDKYGRLNQRKLSRVIEKEIRALLVKGEINFFIALSYFVEKLRFYKKEKSPKEINFWVRGNLEIQMSESWLRIPYRSLSIAPSLIPNLAAFMFGLHRSPDYFYSCNLFFPEKTKDVLTTLVENRFPQKLEFKETLKIDQPALNSKKGYERHKDQDIKKRTLIKMFQKLPRDQKEKAREFIKVYKEAKVANLCLPV